MYSWAARRQTCRMEHDIGAFLRSRRARLRPEDVGLSAIGRRRVPGLRREELANLAGVSVDYYVRLEQGRSSNVSDSVLDAVARSLQLSEPEREHLYVLARPRPTPDLERSDQPVLPTIRRLLEAMDGVPAFVLGRRTDVLAWNAIADAVLGFESLQPCDRNIARFTFMHPDAPALYSDWQQVAEQTVAYLALDAGRHPGDAALERLVGELSIASERFRELWARHDIFEQRHGPKRVDHPIVGHLEFAYQTLLVPEDPDQLLVTLVPEPSSSTQKRLLMLERGRPAVDEDDPLERLTDSADGPHQGSRSREARR
jgi:transcriptional regulator with XRE-family HTH domain